MRTAGRTAGHLRARWRSFDRRVLDSALALVCIAQIWFGLAGRSLEPNQNPTSVWAYALAILIGAPIAVHRRRPLAAAVVMNAALVLYGVGRFSAFPGVPVFVLAFLVGLHFGRRTALKVLAVSAACLSIAIALQPAGVASASTWVATGLFLLVSWLLGENQRARRARWLALEERAQRSEAEREERARQAVAAERLRIARELHDVVAHAMSVIAVQSGMGRHVIDSRPDEARKALSSIESTSRSALVEMRRLLGVLRQGDEPQGALAPAPGLADVPGLVSQVQASGLQVELHVDGEDVDVPSGVELSAYRIVQEGLTNVLRHGGSSVVVDIRRTPAQVDIELCDDGVRGPQSRPHAVDGHLRAAPGGHGLIGIRERVAVFQGRFSAGPRPGGGFRLAASLPFDPAAETSAQTWAVQDVAQ